MRILFLYLCLLFFCISCKKKPIQDDNPVGVNSKCKDCAYYPVCDGQTYTYEKITNGGTISELKDTFRYIKDTIVNSVTFKKILVSHINASQFTYLSCMGGAVKELLAYAVLTTLDPNLAVNGQWIDTIIYPSGIIDIYKSTIKEKNISRTVNNRNFSDVIHVLLEGSRFYPTIGNTTLDNIDSYYASGVGLIERKYSNPFLSTFIELIKIKDFNVP